MSTVPTLVAAAPAMAAPAHAARTRLDLPHLLDGAAQVFPNRPALADIGNRGGWTSGEPRRFTLGSARREVDRIGGLFHQFRLSPGAIVAVQMANVPEAALALLGVLRAGLVPLMLPLKFTAQETARAVEDAQAEAAITMTAAGPLRPADAMRDVAAGHMGLRFVTAFGDDVPDGMIGLDRLPWSLAEAAPPLENAADGQIGTFDEGTRQAYARTGESLIAAGLGVVAAARMRPGQRIVSLLAPDDLAGLATGLVPSLAAGIPLVMAGLFDSIALQDAFGEGQPTHLIAPAWLEPMIAASALSRHPCLAGIVFVHKLPWERRVAHNDSGAPRLGELPVVDVLSLGEYTIFIAPRRGEGASFDLSAVTPRLSSGHALVEARLSDGMLEVRGRASRSRALAGLRRDGETLPEPDMWSPLPLAVETDGAQLLSIDRLQRGF